MDDELPEDWEKDWTLTSEEKEIEARCYEVVEEILSRLDVNFSYSLSKFNNAYQFNVSTKKLIWDLDLVDEICSALNAYDYVFWEDEKGDDGDGLFVYFEFDSLIDNNEAEKNDEDTNLIQTAEQKELEKECLSIVENVFDGIGFKGFGYYLDRVDDVYRLYLTTYQLIWKKDLLIRMAAALDAFDYGCSAMDNGAHFVCFELNKRDMSERLKN